MLKNPTSRAKLFRVNIALTIIAVVLVMTAF